MIPTEEKQLLAQGVKDYTNALNAISAFRSLVQKKCRRAVEDNLDDYAKALGISLSNGSLIDYDWSDGSEFSVGVKCLPKGSAYIELCHSLWWGPGEQGNFQTGVYVWIWTGRKNIELLREI